MTNVSCNALLTGLLRSLDGFVATLALCLPVFLLGYFWFIRTKKGFADVL